MERGRASAQSTPRSARGTRASAQSTPRSARGTPARATPRSARTTPRARRGTRQRTDWSSEDEDESSAGDYDMLCEEDVSARKALVEQRRAVAAAAAARKADWGGGPCGPDAIRDDPVAAPPSPHVSIAYPTLSPATLSPVDQGSPAWDEGDPQPGDSTMELSGRQPSESFAEAEADGAGQEEGRPAARKKRGSVRHLGPGKDKKHAGRRKSTGGYNREKAAMHLLSLGNREKEVLSSKLAGKQQEMDTIKQSESSKVARLERKVAEYEANLRKVEAALMQEKADKQALVGATVGSAGQKPTEKEEAPPGESQTTVAIRGREFQRKYAESQVELQKQKHRLQKLELQHEELKEEAEHLRVLVPKLRAVVDELSGGIDYELWASPEELEALKTKHTEALLEQDRLREEREKHFALVRENHQQALDRQIDQAAAARKEKQLAQQQTEEVRQQLDNTRDELLNAQQKIINYAKEVANLEKRHADRVASPTAVSQREHIAELTIQLQCAEEDREQLSAKITGLHEENTALKEKLESVEWELDVYQQRERKEQETAAASSAGRTSVEPTPPTRPTSEPPEPPEPVDPTSLPVSLVQSVFSWLTPGRTGGAEIVRREFMPLVESLHSVLGFALATLPADRVDEARPVVEDLAQELEKYDLFLSLPQPEPRAVSPKEAGDEAGSKESSRLEIEVEPPPVLRSPKSPKKLEDRGMQTDPVELVSPSNAQKAELPLGKAPLERDKELAAEDADIAMLQRGGKELSAAAEQLCASSAPGSPRMVKMLQRMSGWQRNCNELWEKRRKNIRQERQVCLQRVLKLSDDTAPPEAVQGKALSTERGPAQRGPHWAVAGRCPLCRRPAAALPGPQVGCFSTLRLSPQGSPRETESKPAFLAPPPADPMSPKPTQAVNSAFDAVSLQLPLPPQLATGPRQQLQPGSPQQQFAAQQQLLSSLLNQQDPVPRWGTPGEQHPSAPQPASAAQLPGIPPGARRGSAQPSPAEQGHRSAGGQAFNRNALKKRCSLLPTLLRESSFHGDDSLSLTPTADDGFWPGGPRSADSARPTPPGSRRHSTRPGAPGHEAVAAAAGVRSSNVNEQLLEYQQQLCDQILWQQRRLREKQQELRQQQQQLELQRKEQQGPWRRPTTRTPTPAAKRIQVPADQSAHADFKVRGESRGLLGEPRRAAPATAPAEGKAARWGEKPPPELAKDGRLVFQSQPRSGLPPFWRRQHGKHEKEDPPTVLSEQERDELLGATFLPRSGGSDDKGRPYTQGHTLAPRSHDPPRRAVPLCD
eukprot:TRINITY_DN55501_c0_g1_i1.p1 TRINITY_DN55501_c0_g1~~TRINITY_DN55501_c0_g1_i1.p1  ORF type:complete len:1281 (+),score=323.95 TRINITY_DN55501_c0_g1_i1:177-4019(+)